MAAGGSGTLTRTTTNFGIAHSIRKIHKLSWDWLCDSTGDVDNTTSLQSGTVHGFAIMARHLPDSAGTQPTDDYDVEIQDENDIDVLGSAGANLSHATAGYIAPVVGTYFHPLVDGKLNIVVSNAGNAKAGVFELYVIE